MPHYHYAIEANAVYRSPQDARLPGASLDFHSGGRFQQMLKMAEAEGFEPPDRRKAGRLYSKQVHLPVLPRFQNLFFLRWRGTTPQVSRVRWIGLLPMYAGV